MSADRHHRNSINVRISDFAPVFWIAARIKRLTLLDHVASWRSPEGGRAYWRTNERNRCWRERNSECDRNGARKREKQPGEAREAEGEKEKDSRAGKEERREVRKGKEKTGRRTKEAPSTDEGQRWELKGETDDDAEVQRFSP